MQKPRKSLWKMDAVTRNDFIKMVMRNAGGNDKKEAEKYVEAFEDAVLEVIAREQLVKFSFGTIYGTFKAPWRITGNFKSKHNKKARRGWSDAKHGQPNIIWSVLAKDSDKVDPEEYFSWPENRYTKLAYQYRKDMDLPEIPEYEGMTEDEIIAQCAEFEKSQLGRIARSRYDEYESSKRAQNHAREVNVQEYWVEKQLAKGVPEDQIQKLTAEEIYEIKEQRRRKRIDREMDAKLRRRIEKSRKKEAKKREYYGFPPLDDDTPTGYEIAVKQYLIDVRGTYESLFGEGEGKIPDRKSKNNLEELFEQRREKNRLIKMMERGEISEEEFNDLVSEIGLSQRNSEVFKD